MDELIKELKTSTKKKKKRINLRGGYIPSQKSAAWNIKDDVDDMHFLYMCFRHICTICLFESWFVEHHIHIPGKKNVCWGVFFFFFFFLVVRAIGGFVTTTLIQLLIQRRIPTNTLSNVARCLIQMLRRPLKSLKRQEETSNMMHNTWLFVFLLLLPLPLLVSLVTSVVGMFLDILRFVMIWTSRIGLVNSSWPCDLRFNEERPKGPMPFDQKLDILIGRLVGDTASNV